MKTIFLITVATASSLIAIPGISQTTVVYTSPLTDYQSMSQPLNDEKVTSWKTANDKVGQIGGWRAYAKEAQQPDNMPVSVPASMQKPAPNAGGDMKANPHAGHKQ